MTKSTARRLRRQYSNARRTWRTTARASPGFTRTSTTGRSPEMPCFHRPGWPRLLRESASDEGRNAASA
ncbi:hypothetical protein Mterra_03674 [Calidithermus terrae]|uniref:Uncharacterized protein n=1 Tax=Calidithermus terrae TaxID=1408545 RepID=A0A399E508_9DEIN|nr:hypothetical protein Mterra_03674 [Calidithermus terrae]